ncbi:MAG: alpha/beta hydrolase [Acidimicrobiales bacterium]
MRSRRSVTVATAAAVTSGAMAGVTGAAAYAAHRISGPRRPWPDYRFTPFEVGVPYEDVAFRAGDGPELAGWWLDRPGSSTVVIGCHGHRGTRSDLLGIGPGLWRAGHTVVLFDCRGNGDSADGLQSLAHHEREDLRAVIDGVGRRRPDAEIVLLGFSMGAAVSIMVAAEDQRVRALVLDSPFADMAGVIRHAMGRLRLPPFPLLGLTDLTTRIRYGYRFRDVEPVAVIGQIAPPAAAPAARPR